MTRVPLMTFAVVAHLPVWPWDSRKLELALLNLRVLRSTDCHHCDRFPADMAGAAALALPAPPWIFIDLPP